MSKVAIFVDAGYLFAQGSTALAGSKQNRTSLSLNVPETMRQLRELIAAHCENCRLLRIYWYDAPPRGSRSSDHTALATSDYVKLRLGTLNSQGEQKGVDSLIVTDMIELARNRSISDAILLSGDEDVRIGVQIAQNYGVTVHLIGIFPSRGSQSKSLREEADSNTEWDADVIGKMLTITSAAKTAAQIMPATGTFSAAPTAMKIKDQRPIDRVVKALLTEDSTNSIRREATDFWEQGALGFPPTIDRPFLAKLRDEFGRELTSDEKRDARAKLKSAIQGKT